jgi:hypothetical protein
MSKNVFPVNNAVYEMWTNKAQPDSPQMTIQHCACVLYATYKHTQDM